MKRQAEPFTTPIAQEVARHLGALVRQGRLARRWTVAELAERARVGTATLKRIEKGAPSVSLGVWLSVFERLGLLPLLKELEDPAAAALLNETRAKRVRHKSAPADLDF
ncbi:MAG TPA: helix-turn-helix domain-containing protein [Steroidobacteraceae bacterium]|nr:helix-turn-helix domain-containing protein [Steroidobacteraceae bacterium]